jgi:hypothetical protein
MSAHTVVPGSDRKEGKAMTRRGFALGRQLGVFAVLAALALSLSGDRTSAAGVPAAVNGLDPLEVLELKVRPNVIVVLDSSGSMNQTVKNVAMGSGDHPLSKLWQAKQVLKKIVADNQDKVSFQFGTYTQNDFAFQNTGAGANRFQYLTDQMPATAFTVKSAKGDTGTRGFQSWQLIYPPRTLPYAQTGWNTFYYQETIGSTTYPCVATLDPGPGPDGAQFYAQGATLAAELTAKMNACARTTGKNVYTVTYAVGTGIFTFSRTTNSNAWNPQWRANAARPNNIRGALNANSSATTSDPTGLAAYSTGTPYTLLYGATSGTFNMNGSSSYRFTDAATSTTYYQLRASRLWNGEVIRVDSGGAICGMDFAATLTNPPSLTVQLADATCSPLTGTTRYVFGGGYFARGGSGDGCYGFRSKSALVPCDVQPPPDQTQVALIAPYIAGELPFDDTGKPADLTTKGVAYNTATYSVPDGRPDYVEMQDGTWAVDSIDVGPAAKADGYTPIANSLIDIKGTAESGKTCVTTAAPVAGKLDSLANTATTGACPQRGFTELWNKGQAGATTQAGPAPWKLDPIKNHKDPKEKTIVLFVTDGDDTCYDRGDNNNQLGDDNALRAALAAQKLYTPLDTSTKANASASSVQTYVIGYGGAFDAVAGSYRLNWIAWGGSGLGQGKAGQPDIGDDGTQWTDSTEDIATAKAQCTTCENAFIAPDAATLAAQLQSIIDQGASDGDFNAQQSITESVYEYMDRVNTAAAPAVKRLDARQPSGRYQGLVPTRFVSSFSLPGFEGHVRAYQNDGTGNSVLLWDAGAKLTSLVTTGMTSRCSTSNACTFMELHGAANDASIAASSAAIKRRIYTTSGNGVYDYTPNSLIAGTADKRVPLWPPYPAVAPRDYTSPGAFDLEMGLPPDTPTAFPDRSEDKSCKVGATSPKSYDQCWVEYLQTKLRACAPGTATASYLPADCPTSTTTTFTDAHVQAARREARDNILAFLAGATPVLDGTGVKRTSTKAILYTARSSVLADSELATVAVVTPPSLSEPEATPYVAEYKLYRDGVGDAPRPDSDLQIRQGFGLARPDIDASEYTNDARTKLKPVMTVLYAPANDMLHAFRAGPSCSPSFTSYSPLAANTACAESGGEELWGFVPYDQLLAVGLRAVYEPQGRDNHVYMIGRGVRYADVFVPGTVTASVANASPPAMKGVWRHVLYFGRGIGGKYVTALDVTAPGPYTAKALETAGPIPLWSRGNPDTQDGLPGGTANNPDEATDRTNYAHMGETWSMPTVAYVNKDRTNTLYKTTRRPDTVEFVIFMGSGYGDPNAAVREGTTHYTLDALTGDVVAAVDVEDAAADAGVTRTLCSVDAATGKPIETPTCSVMKNALVANSVSFNWSAFESVSAKVFNTNPHTWSYETTRVYITDLHGRLWKFLTANPGKAVLAADLGANQPVGTAVALLGEKVFPTGSDVGLQVPNIFVTSGADKRASGPFRIFSLMDGGTDESTDTTGNTTANGVTTYQPVTLNFARTFDQGAPEANCGYTTEAVFRGTIQPTSAVECVGTLTGARCEGDLVQRVFFGGTRLSLPNTKYAPPTPLACSSTGQYPCRSQFDSILYALGVKSGQAAYTLGGESDAYRIFRDSRIAALSFQADPETATGSKGSRFTADEGLMKTTPPKAPPPPGVPPTATTATANVIYKREPGQPPPTVHYGSTVCE